MNNAELIERLQKLTGPCRETDGRIAYAIEPKRFEDIADQLARADSLKWQAFAGICNAPAYTGSVDAALTLVPPKMCLRLFVDYADSTEPDHHAEIAFCTSGYWRYRDECEGATPAIAACIAALEAREALCTDESGPIQQGKEPPR